MGKAMRATADNPERAQIRGIDTERVIAWTWCIGGGLAAAGGVMYALASQLRPDMGFTLLLPMFAGVIMGGTANASGVLVAATAIAFPFQLTPPSLTPPFGPPVVSALLCLPLLGREDTPLDSQPS